MVLSAQTIFELDLIYPLYQRTEFMGLTYGISACGYDVRVEFDVAGFDLELTIPPNGFVLASTIEHFTIPNDIVGIVHDKSSWARKGLTVQNTVIEPGWSGYLTLELTNHNSDKSIKLIRGLPIAQVVFHYLDKPTQYPYSGKYQNQNRGPQESR